MGVFFCFDALSRGTAFSTFREPRAGQTLGRRNARAMSEVNGARVDLATRRTLVMSVRYALRISVDDATEETPSAAYRSGSPESVESGAAGIVAGVSAKRSGHVKGARTMRRRRASGRGGRSADPWRTEDGGSSRVRGRGLGAGRRARCVRRSDARERRDDGKTRRGKRRKSENGRRRTGETARGTIRSADRRGTDAFHRDSMGQRVPTRRINYIPFRLAWRPQKAQRRENPQPARAFAIPRRPARARASDPHHGVPQRHG